MTCTRNCLILAASMLPMLPVLAAPAQAQFVEGWAGEASLTGSRTTGNTETTNLGVAVDVSKTGDTWRHNLKASADYGEADDAVNRRRYRLGYQIDRDIGDRFFVYGNASYFSEDFGAFQEGYFIGSGLGYDVPMSDTIKWKVEAGLGFRSQEEQGALGAQTDEVAASAASNFDWTLNDNVSLFNKTELIHSSSDTYLWNDIGLTATIRGNLAARASFRVDYHSDVPLGTENTDTITRFGLVYTMG